ncbi:MAG TPA: sialidase family protein [Parafilimonas sp.]|nr:sialidase family protein [Parafilimonas sp.]
MMNKIFFLFFLLASIASCTDQHPATDVVAVIGDGKMPAIAGDVDNNVSVAYGSGDQLMCTYSRDGQTFGSPEIVAELPGLVASATRGPQITATKNGLAIIAVNKDGNIFSYVKDASGEWISTGRVNDIDTTDKEGFIALASDEGNNLFAIWPDLRADHQNKIFGARSNDGGRTWMRNILVYRSPDKTICECCKPSVVMNGRNVFVMFRNWLHGNRDLYLATSSDGGESFGQAQKLGSGNWKLDACPMDGGGLTVNSSGAVSTVWRRQSKIYACEPGQVEKEIGEGKSCSIEDVYGKDIYAWIADGDIVCLLPGGKLQTIGHGSSPVLKKMSEKKAVCVWEDDGKINAAMLTF